MASFAESPSRRDFAGFDEKAFSGDATIKGWSIWNKTREGRADISYALVKAWYDKFLHAFNQICNHLPIEKKRFARISTSPNVPLKCPKNPVKPGESGNKTGRKWKKLGMPR